MRIENLRMDQGKEEGRFSPISWVRKRTPSLPSCLTKRKLSFIQKLNNRKKSAPHLQTPPSKPPDLLPLPTTQIKTSSKKGTPCRTPSRTPFRSPCRTPSRTPCRTPEPPPPVSVSEVQLIPNPDNLLHPLLPGVGGVPVCRTPQALLSPSPIQVPMLNPLETLGPILVPLQVESTDNNGNKRSCGRIDCSLRILYLERLLEEKMECIEQLKENHNENLAQISSQLFVLQANLSRKEKYLDQLIIEREQTIMEQQRIIRRLLRKRLLSSSLPDKESDEKAPSPPCSDLEINDTDSAVVIDDNMEISISVPNLADKNMNITKPLIDFNRSISENEGTDRNAKEERALKLKNERRISNRQKLLAMKRYSGFLKRPEILETVYSVEEDVEGQKSFDLSQDQENEPEQEPEQEVKVEGKMRKFRIDSDITDYDYSTDSESLRFFFSETDPSGCNTGCNTSELCSRRSSCGSQPNLLDVGKEGDDSSKSRSMEDLRGKLKHQPHPLPEMKAIDRRRRMFQQHTSVSLDCND